MVGLKFGLEMVSFSLYDYLCTFMCASKFILFALIGELKRALIYESRVV